jgi:AP-4 complex subunit epsilon-1
VDQMMGYLSSCTDEHIRKDIVRKVCHRRGSSQTAPSPSPSLEARGTVSRPS